MAIEKKFIINMAKALHLNGVPAHRLERIMDQMCSHLRIHAEIFCSPTALFISFSDNNNSNTSLNKVNSIDFNLEKLEAIDKLKEKVLHNHINIEQALIELDLILDKTDRYNSFIRILSFGLSTASAAGVFKGGYKEIIIAFIIGITIGILFEVPKWIPSFSRVLILVASAIAIIISELAFSVIGSYDMNIALVTGLIIVIPGFSFTISITELANGHSISGTSRMVNAFISFAMIAFGIVIGSQIYPTINNEITEVSLSFAPFWIQYVSLILVPLGFVILFKALPKHYIWMLFACLVSFFSMNMFTNITSNEVSIFLSSLTLGVVCNVTSKLNNKPTALMMVPGIILLVPGAIGFSSVSSFLNTETLNGIENVFSMIVSAVALALGLIIANMLTKYKQGI